MIPYEKIERVVCECVNEAFDGGECLSSCAVTAEMLYSGNTKPLLRVAVARQFCYMVMHDLYHASYSSISKRVGFSERSVVGGCKKARELSFIDDVYSAVRELITQRI